MNENGEFPGSFQKNCESYLQMGGYSYQKISMQ